MRNQLKIFIKTMKIMGNKRFIYLLGIFFMSTGWAMFSVMSSLLIKNVVDAATDGEASRIPVIIAVNVAGGLMSLLVYRAAAIRYNIEAKRAYGNICKRVFRHEIRLPYSYYEKHHSGEFISKLSYDLEKMGSIYGSRLRRTCAPILQVIVYVVPMLILSWQITLCLVVVNILMLLINGILIEPIRRVSGRLSVINSRMTENMSNLLQGMEQARMNRAGYNTVDEYVRQNALFRKESTKKVLYTAILESASSGFELLCSLAFLMLGIYFVKNNYTTLGSLSAIYSLYGVFSKQFLQLGRYLPELIGCLVNAANIFEFLDTDEEPECWYGQEEVIKNKKTEEETEGAVTDGLMVKLDNIEFCYREDKPLLSGFSMDVETGESVAITGPSGCGKTTVSKLLMELYPVKNGDICIDGRNVRSEDIAAIRKRIAYVPQEPYLFNETIMENIRMGREDASDEEVIEAAKKANAHDFIEKLPDGYMTMAGERGNLLSGGQRQRIAIARAIIKDAPVMLLDEATSALDNESERLVNEALKSMKNKKTIIMIAHRPSTIALADKICDIS